MDEDPAEFEDELLTEAPATQGADAVRNQALRLLASREHSRRELERKLLARGYEAAVLAGVLDALTETGLLSDERMAEAYVAGRLRKGFGPLRLRQELRERGLDDDLIGPCLDRSASDWLELMTRVAARKFGPGRVTDRKELARRARFLEYRGFPPDLVGRYLRGGSEA
ncbi:MAG: regulatory protein RecX [Chromatiaceae bacterium]|nr:regulatory protein RecX [Chromatiaceae bacterium]